MSNVPQVGESSVALAAQYETFTPEQVSLIHKQIMPANSSYDEMAMFLHHCTRTGLDPLSKQVYAIKRGQSLTFQTSIDGFRAIAERSGEMDGRSGPFWCDSNGTWTDVWLGGDDPFAAKVTIFRKGQTHGYTSVALWTEYAQNGGLWRTMPALMLAKCAESLALRQAFPADLSGLYTGEEMGQASNAAPIRQEVQQAVEAPAEVVQPDPPKRGDDARKMTSRIESTCEICNEKIERKVPIAFKRDDKGTGHAAHWECYENQNGETTPDLHDHAPELGNETGEELLEEANAAAQLASAPMQVDSQSNLTAKQAKALADVRAKAAPARESKDYHQDDDLPF